MPIALPYVVEYTVQVELPVAPAAVAELVADPSRYGLWQPEFHGMTPVSGEPGCAGSSCRLRFAQGDGQAMDVVEEVQLSQLPHRHHTLFRTGDVLNCVENTFTALDNGGTRWAAKHHFEINDRELALLAKEHPTMFRDASREGMHRLIDYFTARQAREITRTPVGSTAVTVDDIEDFERRQLLT